MRMNIYAGVLLALFTITTALTIDEKPSHYKNPPIRNFDGKPSSIKGIDHDDSDQIIAEQKIKSGSKNNKEQPIENEEEMKEPEDAEEKDDMAQDMVAVGVNSNQMAALVPANMTMIKSTGINRKHIIGYVPISSKNGAFVLPAGAVQVINQNVLRRNPLEDNDEDDEPGEERGLRKRKRVRKRNNRGHVKRKRSRRGSHKRRNVQKRKNNAKRHLKRKTSGKRNRKTNTSRMKNRLRGNRRGLRNNRLTANRRRRNNNRRRPYN